MNIGSCPVCIPITDIPHRLLWWTRASFQWRWKLTAWHTANYSLVNHFSFVALFNWTQAKSWIIHVLPPRIQCLIVYIIQENNMILTHAEFVGFVCRLHALFCNALMHFYGFLELYDKHIWNLLWAIIIASMIASLQIPIHGLCIGTWSEAIIDALTNVKTWSM